MSLKLRIKPEGKLFVNGNGWIKNVGNRPMEVILDGGLQVMVEEKRLHFVEKHPDIEFEKAENPNSWTPLVRPNAKG